MWVRTTLLPLEVERNMALSVDYMVFIVVLATCTTLAGYDASLVIRGRRVTPVQR